MQSAMQMFVARFASKDPAFGVAPMQEHPHAVPTNSRTNRSIKLFGSDDNPVLTGDI
jgi:hypothetical protein